jgi:ArsR family transcriptional regulator
MADIRKLTSTKTPSKKFAPSLSDDDARNQARLLKALADPTRLRILSTLSRYGGEVCVAELVENFDLEQPTISHHLRILRDAGYIDCRKRGLWAYYYLRPQLLDDAKRAIHALLPQAQQPAREKKERRVG